MNKALLSKHIQSFLVTQKKDPERSAADFQERSELVNYYRSFTAEKILNLTEDEIYEYLSKLWAMQIWGNKHYVIDKIIKENGLDHFRKYLAGLVWGKDPISLRWDKFRKDIRGIGPAMISEILCKVNPDKYLLWNRRVFVGLRYLEVKNLPRYDYQFTGELYEELCAIGIEIAEALNGAGFQDNSLLSVDYFIWDELQVEDSLTEVYEAKPRIKPEKTSQEALAFIHNDIRDKLREIGEWLGFSSDIERKVAEGSKVDTVWEATIGNMGRVIYVFEVQTKGSIDSLVINLLKSLNNPAVQGVVAVSDGSQLLEIERQVRELGVLHGKLRYWNYEEVLKVHESLAFVNENINRLKLVPEGF